MKYEQEKERSFRFLLKEYVKILYKVCYLYAMDEENFKDKKEILPSHQSEKKITFTVETDPTGCGDWMEYAIYTGKAGRDLETSIANGIPSTMDSVQNR